MSALILIAEDERKIAAVLGDYLNAAGMRSVHVGDGAEVLAAVARHAPDLVLLDLMLPHEDGYSLCRALRRDSTVPIIMLTAKVEEIDRLLGLELGADDYICKPFSPREVVARIKAVLRRTHPPDTSSAMVVIDQDRQRASIGTERLDLTPIEFKLLATLARHPGRVYRRDELLDLIYDDFRDVSDRTVDSHIKNLRRKLEHAAPNRRLIHSVYGIGYRYEVE
jgi:two-component system response regulator BaeR